MAGLAAELDADVVVAACTEIPLVRGPADLPVPLISSTEALVDVAIGYARGAALPYACKPISADAP